MNERYKIDEKLMKDIFKSNVKPTNVEQNLEIIIYYRNLKTKPDNEKWSLISFW